MLSTPQRALIEANNTQVTVTFSEQESAEIREYCQEHGIDAQEYVDTWLKSVVMDRLYS